LQRTSATACGQPASPAPQKNIREKAGMPIAQPDAALLERFLAPMRATIPREVRDAELAAGRALSQQQAVTLVVQPVLNS
jgi:hypothetical protein